MPNIDRQKILAITVRPSMQVIFTDAAGKDIASVLINDKHPSAARLVFKVSEHIKIRRESTK